MIKHLIIFLFSLQSLYAQVATFEGVVKDKETKEVIPYANIYAIDSKKGTLSNEEGIFQITSIGEKMTLIVSHISYQADTIEIYSEKKSTIFFLSKRTLDLPTMTVSNYPTQLMKKALDNRKNGTTLYADAFYRQITKNNNQIIAFEEVFYKAKYSPRSIQGLNIQQARYAVSPKLPTPFSYIENNSFFLFSKALCTKGFPHSKKLPKTDYFFPNERESIDYYNININNIDNGIAEIECTISDEYKNYYFMNGKFLVDTTSKMVISLSLYSNNSFGVDLEEGHFYRTNFNYKIDIDTKKTPYGRFINSMNTSTSYDVFNKKTGQKENISVTNLVLLTNENPKEENSLVYKPIVYKVNDVEKLEKVPYDNNFWRNNSVVKRTPLEENVIKLFEKAEIFTNVK